MEGCTERHLSRGETGTAATHWVPQAPNVYMDVWPLAGTLDTKWNWRPTSWKQVPKPGLISFTVCCGTLFLWFLDEEQISLITNDSWCVKKWKCQLLSQVQPFVTPWTVAHLVPLSMEFSRQEYWSGLPLRVWGCLFFCIVWNIFFIYPEALILKKHRFLEQYYY